MKRRLFTPAIYLLLGAVLNVAVAWGCAVLAERPQTRVSFAYRASTISVVKPNASVFYQYNLRRLGSVKDVRVFLLLPQDKRTVVQARAGWPMLSLYGKLEEVMSQGTMSKDYTRAIGLLPAAGPLRLVTEPIVPLRPVWPGFAVNTLFYAAILWLAIPGPFALRRHIRRRRGLCITCGYDIRHADHDACPECGASPKSATA